MFSQKNWRPSLRLQSQRKPRLHKRNQWQLQSRRPQNRPQRKNHQPRRRQKSLRAVPKLRDLGRAALQVVQAVAMIAVKTKKAQVPLHHLETLRKKSASIRKSRRESMNYCSSRRSCSRRNRRSRLSPSRNSWHLRKRWRSIRSRPRSNLHWIKRRRKR